MYTDINKPLYVAVKCIGAPGHIEYKMIAVRPKINSALCISGCHVIPHVHFEINTPSFEAYDSFLLQSLVVEAAPSPTTPNRIESEQKEGERYGRSK